MNLYHPVAVTFVTRVKTKLPRRAAAALSMVLRDGLGHQRQVLPRGEADQQVRRARAALPAASHRHRLLHGRDRLLRRPAAVARAL